MDLLTCALIAAVILLAVIAGVLYNDNKQLKFFIREQDESEYEEYRNDVLFISTQVFASRVANMGAYKVQSEDVYTLSVEDAVALIDQTNKQLNYAQDKPSDISGSF